MKATDMTPMEVHDLGRKLCEYFCLTYDVGTGDYYIRYSSSHGSGIHVGWYKDMEEMLVSIFHEIGHCRKCTTLHKLYNNISEHYAKVPRDTKLCNEGWFLLRYGREYRAWKWGFKAMRLLGIEVTPKMIQFANESLETYNRTTEYGTKPDGFIGKEFKV